MTRRYTLLSAKTTTGAGDSTPPIQDNAQSSSNRTAQVAGSTTAGAGAAEVVIEVSNDGSNWITAGTVTLTLGTTSTSDGFVMDAAWLFVRANVSSISGTGAAVSAYLGV